MPLSNSYFRIVIRVKVPLGTRTSEEINHRERISYHKEDIVDHLLTVHKEKNAMITGQHNKETTCFNCMIATKYISLVFVQHYL